MSRPVFESASRGRGRVASSRALSRRVWPIALMEFANRVAVKTARGIGRLPHRRFPIYGSTISLYFPFARRPLQYPKAISGIAGECEWTPCVGFLASIARSFASAVAPPRAWRVTGGAPPTRRRRVCCRRACLPGQAPSRHLNSGGRLGKEAKSFAHSRTRRNWSRLQRWRLRLRYRRRHSSPAARSFRHANRTHQYLRRLRLPALGRKRSSPMLTHTEKPRHH
jgi:hypothetical protein